MGTARSPLVTGRYEIGNPRDISEPHSRFATRTGRVQSCADWGNGNPAGQLGTRRGDWEPSTHTPVFPFFVAHLANACSELQSAGQWAAARKRERCNSAETGNRCLYTFPKLCRSIRTSHSAQELWLQYLTNSSGKRPLEGEVPSRLKKQTKGQTGGVHVHLS